MKKPYSDKRWTDIPKGEDVGGFDISEEDRKKYDADFEKILRQNGVLKPGETIKKYK